MKLFARCHGCGKIIIFPYYELECNTSKLKIHGYNCKKCHQKLIELVNKIIQIEHGKLL